MNGKVSAAVPNFRKKLYFSIETWLNCAHLTRNPKNRMKKGNVFTLILICFQKCLLDLLIRLILATFVHCLKERACKSDTRAQMASEVCVGPKVLQSNIHTVSF